VYTLIVLRPSGKKRRNEKNATDQRRKRNEAPALIYVVTNGDAIKVGIGDSTERRLRDHGSQGWKIRRVYKKNGEGITLTRIEARKVEKTILTDWRNRELPFGKEQEEMPQGGYTETTLIERVNIRDACKSIEIELGILRRKHWYSFRRTVNQGLEISGPNYDGLEEPTNGPTSP
jgi:hypothetical protein